VVPCHRPFGGWYAILATASTPHRPILSPSQTKGVVEDEEDEMEKRCTILQLCMLCGLGLYNTGRHQEAGKSFFTCHRTVLLRGNGTPLYGYFHPQRSRHSLSRSALPPRLSPLIPVTRQGRLPGSRQQRPRTPTPQDTSV
jgi:hypothetical protein